jgi:predicted ABC-type sugar transport system permease subunit
VFFADHVLLNGFFLFLGKWVYEVVMNVVERRMQGAELLMQILVWSSLSAFVTAVAGVLALMALRPVLETRAA